MAVPNDAPSEEVFAGAGSAAPLQITWRFIDGNDLVVTAIVGGLENDTPLVRGVDYTVTGGGIGGGTVIPETAIPAGTSWRVRRETPKGQPATLPTGSFNPNQIEQALDRQGLVGQEQEREVERTLRVPRGETGMVLPPKADRVLRALAFGESGEDVLAIPVDQVGVTADRAATAAALASTLVAKAAAENARDEGVDAKNLALAARNDAQTAAAAALATGRIFDTTAAGLGAYPAIGAGWWLIDGDNIEYHTTQAGPVATPSGLILPGYAAMIALRDEVLVARADALAATGLEVASDHDVVAGIVVADPDGLTYRLLAGYSKTTGPVGNGARAPFVEANDHYSVRGEPGPLGYSATITRLIGPLTPDAQGMTGLAGTAVPLSANPVLDLSLSSADVIAWLDAAANLRYWRPAAGLPASQVDPGRKWLAPKRVNAGARVAIFGDSLSVDLNGVSPGAPAGFDTFTDAFPGSTVDQILNRVGVRAPLMRVTGGSIPGDGSYVALTQLTPQFDIDRTYEGFINDVPVFFRRTAGIYEVARQAPGAAVAVADDTPFIQNLDDVDDRILFYWIGRNDIEQNPALAADTIADLVLAGFSDAYEAANTLDKQVLFVPPPQSETDTATQKAAVAEIRARLKAQYGDYLTDGVGACLDLTAVAFDTGPNGLLARTGFVATADDLADIAAGLWPRQLRYDVVHQYPIVTNQIRNLIYDEVMPGKGWF